MDIALHCRGDVPVGDWNILDEDLALDNPLRSAVMVSLFSDATADDELWVDGKSSGLVVASGAAGSVEADRRGWWGDDPASRGIGSRLWQLSRGIKTDATTLPTVVSALAKEALTWLIDDNIVASISTEAAWHQKQAGTIVLKVTLRQPDINAPSTFQFSWAWEGLH